MPHFDEKNLWNNYVLTPIVFGWKDLLAEWNESLVMPRQIKILMDNLQAASDWSTDFDIPLDKFLRYLNYEKEAVQWFIYEIIAMRWMWGESRLDFVNYLIHQRDDLVDLNATFGMFPGSPKTAMTLRQFLIEHLSHDELAYLNLPAAPVTTYPPCGPKAKLNVSTQFSPDGSFQNRQVFSDPVIAAFSNAIGIKDENSAFGDASEPKDECVGLPPLIPPTPRSIVVVKKADMEKEKVKVTKFSPVLFRFCRKPALAAQDEDEMMWLYKTGDDEYKIVFQDKQHPKKLKQNVEHLDRVGVQRFLSATFRMMHLDTDPFANIQIQFPHLPEIMVKPMMRSEDRNIVYDAMDLTFDNWPTHTD